MSLIKELENFRKSFTERYEYKPIPGKLYHPLIWFLDGAMIAALWLMVAEAHYWLGIAIICAAAIGFFVVITRTRR